MLGGISVAIALGRRCGSGRRGAARHAGVDARALPASPVANTRSTSVRGRLGSLRSVRPVATGRRASTTVPRVPLAIGKTPGREALVQTSSQATPSTKRLGRAIGTSCARPGAQEECRLAGEPSLEVRPERAWVVLAVTVEFFLRIQHPTAAVPAGYLPATSLVTSHTSGQEGTTGPEG